MLKGFPDTPCLLEAATGKAYGYRELLDSLRAPAPWEDRVCATESSWDVLRILARVILLAEEWVLLDADAAVEERRAAGRVVESVSRQPEDSCPELNFKSWQTAFAEAAGGRLVLFTSGTTGIPKAVNQSLDRLRRGFKKLGTQDAYVWGSVYHPAHMAGIQVALQALGNGHPLVVLRGCSDSDTYNAIRHWGISHLCGTPTFFRLLLPLAAPLKGVRQISLGGETLDESLLRRIEKDFPAARVRNIYASTEAGSLFASQGVWFEIPESLQEQVKIVDGELFLHRTLLGRGSGAELWHATGDLVSPHPQDARRFQLLGRSESRLSIGGYRVDPGFVEAALMELPEIHLARVYGQPNSVIGTLLCADCVGEPIPDRELRQRLSARLAHYQIPRQLRWLDNLPLTRTGKLERSAVSADI